NVEDDDDARNELYKISGDQIVPLTTIDGKAYVISFDKAKLDALLNL
ncbi:MAG: glutaredoxin family protein, partial [Acholeplasmataceae bacterium]|nr:glutaredoxin family protein [Acholeplasmataceae bacterium]